jgi:hypothetical protein
MDRGRIAGDGANVASEVTREIAERDPDSIMGGHVGGEFVVATAQVLHERMTGRDRAHRSDRRHAT